MRIWSDPTHHDDLAKVLGLYRLSTRSSRDGLMITAQGGKGRVTLRSEISIAALEDSCMQPQSFLTQIIYDLADRVHAAGYIDHDPGDEDRS